tara:strand:+ start:330 stop:548 length:219 start_codon:yes stop_codon:yes gene_type:complete
MKSTKFLGKLKFFEIIKSILAAAIGIQSLKNQKKDFNSNKGYVYIAFGILFTIIFVSFLIIVVKTIEYKVGI